MASKITPKMGSSFGYLRCNLPKDTIDIDLKIHTLRGIYPYKKGRSSDVNRYNPCGIEITPLPSLKKNMTKFMR